MVRSPAKARRLHAQTSVEFLLVVAAALVVLGAAIVVSERQAVEIVQINAHNQARTSVEELSAAAREVYSQGEGARRQVFVELPPGYDYPASFVANRSIKMRVAGSDYAATTDFDVYGSLPPTAGGHWVWVVSEGNRIRIGLGLLRIDRASITAVMERNSTHTESFSIQNIYTEPVQVTLVPSWTPVAVALTLDATTFSLDVEEERTVQATLQSDGTALGFYNGYIDISGEATNATELQRLPVTIEVVLPSGSDPLRIIPSTWNETMELNTTTNRTFSVCTGPSTSVPSVDFTTTVGVAGEWVGNLVSLPAMTADSCLDKAFSLSVPSNASTGIYGGAIFGSGGGDAEDSIALAITVLPLNSSTNDTAGPIVHNVTHSPVPAYGTDVIQIQAVGDDSLTGNSPLLGCQLRPDNDPTWQSMTAADGTFDEPVESIRGSLSGLTAGGHVLSLRCTDLLGNIGPVTTYNLTILVKSILFITKDNGAAPAEQDWADWLDSHSSGEGYSWAYDKVHRNQITQGDVSVYAYRVVLVAEDVSSGSVGDDLVDILKTYAADGGYIISADKANDDFPQEMDVSNSGYSSNRKYIYINDNTHYITQNLSIGTLNIFSTDTKTWRQNDFTGSYLATSQSDAERVVLGESDNVLVWGPTKPNTFLSIGHNITRRVFDYAIANSAIGG